MVDKTLESNVTQGFVTYVTSIKYDLIKKTIEVSLINSPKDSIADCLVMFEKIEDFSEDILESEEADSIESLIGLDQYPEGQRIRYVIHTDVREVMFVSQQKPRIERVEPCRIVEI